MMMHPTLPTHPKVAVIMATYNGADRLPDTLRHLAAQRTPYGFTWHVVVVNNASTDDTDLVVRSTWQRLGQPAPLSLLHMPTPGKSHALTLAMQSIKAEYVLICDDDNWLSEDYLCTACAIMDTHPHYGIIGGRADAVSDVPIPDWFYEEQYAYACGAPCSVNIDLTGKGVLWGAGMVIRHKLASLILHPQVPTLLTGRRGQLLTAGEDDEKCVRVWLTGYRTYFDYRLKLQHFMPAHRLTIAYKEQLLDGFNEQGPIIAAYKRLYYLLQLKENRIIFLFKQLVAWGWNLLRNRKENCRIARDYVYYITRWKWSETNVNQQVWSFYNFIRLELPASHSSPINSHR